MTIPGVDYSAHYDAFTAILEPAISTAGLSTPVHKSLQPSPLPSEYVGLRLLARNGEANRLGGKQTRSPWRMEVVYVAQSPGATERLSEVTRLALQPARLSFGGWFALTRFEVGRDIEADGDQHYSGSAFYAYTI